LDLSWVICSNSVFSNSILIFQFFTWPKIKITNYILFNVHKTSSVSVCRTLNLWASNIFLDITIVIPIFTIFMLTAWFCYLFNNLISILNFECNIQSTCSSFIVTFFIRAPTHRSTTFIADLSTWYF
jgi:hypothetical protein